MLRGRIFTASLCIALLACAGAPAPPSDAQLPRADDGVLYAIGASLGQPIQPYHLDEAELGEMMRGFADSAMSRPYAGVSNDELPQQVGLWDEVRKKEIARREELAAAPFLDEAARAKNAVKTESGMIVTVLEPGTGAAPTIFDWVTLNYHGTLRDGTVFHSNRDKDPEKVQLGTTVRCWQEALGAAAPGARLHVVCPPALGYGWGGWPGTVPGGAVLIFDLELLAVSATP